MGIRDSGKEEDASVALGKLLNFFVPQFFHIESGISNSILQSCWED